jgi:hypothetical protein
MDRCDCIFRKTSVHNVLTVGAVYDRASVAFEWKKRAVIDRAYSWKGSNVSYER